MGDFSLTCTVSGLGIHGGTPVRCLLLVESPYGDDDPRRSWLIRTPPIRARYNSYGSVEDVHPDDAFIARLWLRGLTQDMVEKGTGDNSFHDASARRDMSLEELFEAVRARRLEVRRDAEHFWMRPSVRDDVSDLLDDEAKARAAATPHLGTIEQVLRQDAEISAAYPDPVSRGPQKGKFHVDEPVPNLVRVRFGQYDHGEHHLAALELALAAVRRAHFAGVVTAGSGRYPDESELVVLPTPGAAKHLRGPEWDMAPGQPNNKDRCLRVGMAVVREDVWQALVGYSDSDSVSLLCDACGQQSCYHDEDRRCPSKSINGKRFKPHDEDARYAHGPVFPAGVDHEIERHRWGETAWYGIDAYRWGVREAWSAVLERFSDRDGDEHDRPGDAGGGEVAARARRRRRSGDDATSDQITKMIDAMLAKEEARRATLSVEQRAEEDARAEERRIRREAEERDRREHPHFGDFLVRDHFLPDEMWPGSWIFRDHAPGVISVADHLSMCLADKVVVPDGLLDTLAELSMVSHAMMMVGVTWKPSVSSGPQYPEWDHHARFARTVLQVSEAELSREAERDHDAPRVPHLATLAEVKLRLAGPGIQGEPAGTAVAVPSVAGKKRSFAARKVGDKSVARTTATRKAGKAGKAEKKTNKPPSRSRRRG